MTRLAPCAALVAVLLFLVHSTTGVAAASPAQLYVAPDGSATSDCTQAAPCSTPTRARDVIRAMRGAARAAGAVGSGLPAGGVVVNLAAGQYAAANSSVPVLTLTSEDSGAPGRPIVYAGPAGSTAAGVQPGDFERAAAAPVASFGRAKAQRRSPAAAAARADPSGLARLMGGTVVPPTAFKPYKGEIMQADLTALGLTDFGEVRPGGLGQCSSFKMDVYVNSEPLLIARYPNVSPTGEWQWSHVHKKVSLLEFHYNGTEAAKWVNEPSLLLHGYWAEGWADSYVRVASINTTASTITIDKATPPIYGLEAPARYYALNILSELDAPGEYYIDTTNGILYLYPPAGVKLESAEVVVSQLNEIVSMTGVSHVTIANLTTQFAQGVGIEGTSVSYVTISGVDANCQGRYGIALSGFNSTVSQTTVEYTGCHGMSIAGGIEASLTRGNMMVVDSKIESFALWKRTYNPGISFSGVGNTYNNNILSDSPHTGIQGGGNDCEFNGNHVSDMAFEVTDSGAWYSGRSWALRGNVLRGNTFLRIKNTERTFLGSPSVQAIYFDDQLSANVVQNNVIIDCHAGILVGGGRRHQITNNTFINTPTAVLFDNRGMNWQHKWCEVGGKFEQELEQLHYQSPPWSTHYPVLPDIMQEHPCVPVYNNISRNTYCNGTFIDRNATTIASWFSTAADNVESCA